MVEQLALWERDAFLAINAAHPNLQPLCRTIISFYSSNCTQAHIASVAWTQDSSSTVNTLV